MSKQLLRCGTSIGANVREAQNAESKKDFIHKMAIAQKEVDETMYFLELLYATEYLSEAVYLSIHKETEEVYKIIKSIIISTKQNMNTASNK